MADDRQVPPTDRDQHDAGPDTSVSYAAAGTEAPRQAWPESPQAAWPQPPQQPWPQQGWPQQGWPQQGWPQAAATVGTMAWAAPISWPVGYVPWGYVNPPPVPPVLEPPGKFHPGVSRRSVVSIAGRKSPGMYLFGLLVGSPAVAALLFMEIGARAGLSFRNLAIPGGVLVGAVCLLTVLGLGAAGLAQSRQRRADGWRDYTGPAPLIVAGMLLATVEGLSLALNEALGSNSGLDGTTETLLKLSMYLVSYVGLVHVMGVRTGALTWRDIIFPRHLAPTMDELRPGGEPAGEVDAWGRRTRSFRSRVAGGIIGDFLLALVMLIPMTIASGVTIRLLLAILGLNAYDLSSPVPTGTQITDRFIALIAIAIIVPIGEEIFFRGFVTNAWGRSLTRNGTLLRGALFFAGIHMINVTTTDADISFRAAIFNMGARVPIAIAITWLYMRRRSIVASGSMHALYNGLLVLISYA